MADNYLENQYAQYAARKAAFEREKQLGKHRAKKTASSSVSTSKAHQSIEVPLNNFAFHNPVQLYFGEGEIAKINTLIPADAKVLLTYGGGSIKRNGIYDQVMAALSGFKIIEFGGIEANPDYDTLIQAVTICKQEEVDFILAVGGGSIIDGSKFIATAVMHDGDPWEIVTSGQSIRKALPIGTVLTLPATSSEMNERAVISRRAMKVKLAFYGPALFPQFSVLDPTAIYSLPKKQISNGLVDVFIHVAEQYMTTTEYMVTDRMAEGIIQTLVELAPCLMTSEQVDYNVAANYMLTATLGLNNWIAMGATQDWASHKIGHELTALTGLDHGETLAIIYPGTMDVMRREKQEKILQYGERIWGITSGDVDTRIDMAIAKTETFFVQTGKKVRLADYGIGQDIIDEIVGRFEEKDMHLGEHGIVTPTHIRKILESRL